MKSLMDIGKTLKRRKQMRNATKVILFFVLIIFLLISIYEFGTYEKYATLLLFFSYIALVLTTLFTPQVETYEKLRYNLYCLKNSIGNNDLEKSVTYLNKMASNTEKLVEEMKTLPFTEITTETLDKLRLFIKYEMYPCILNKNSVTHSHTIELNQIQSAIETNDFTTLKNILKNKTFENVDMSILLPYEKTSTVKKYSSLIMNILNKAFYESFVFRVTCIITILLIIGFIISSKISTISFDTTLISALIILGSVIAQQIKPKE